MPRSIRNSSTPNWDEEFDFAIGREETTEDQTVSQWGPAMRPVYNYGM